MANGPQDYRDPKVTTTERRSSMAWLWWVLGAIVLLLLLGWLLGWFGADDTDAVVVTEPAATEGVVTDEVVVTEPEPAVEGAVTEEPATEGTVAPASE